MVFQAYTTGYLITTAESVLLTGKRNPPIWLSLLTIFAAVSVLIGGILLLLFFRNDSVPGVHQNISETFLGVVALLLVVLFPANLAIKFYLRLENPVTLPRSNIMHAVAEDSIVKMLATIKGGDKPVWFYFNTRCQEEAENIRFNLAVHAHGRLRCYPITFLPKDPPTIIYPRKEKKGPVQL